MILQPSPELYDGSVTELKHIHQEIVEVKREPMWRINWAGWSVQLNLFPEVYGEPNEPVKIKNGTGVEESFEAAEALPERNNR